MKQRYDVFISYRREGSQNLERLIRDRLTERGYSVFLDIESLKSGKFNEQLYSVIKDCTDMILILPPHSLERCQNENDWVRREISCALRNNVNIIPIMMDGFRWDDAILPSDITEVQNCQGISPDMTYFDAVIDRLCSYLRCSIKLKNECDSIKHIPSYTQKQEKHNSLSAKKVMGDIMGWLIIYVFFAAISSFIGLLFLLFQKAVKRWLYPNIIFEKMEVSGPDFDCYMFVAASFGIIYALFRTLKALTRHIRYKDFQSRVKACEVRNLTPEILCYDNYETFSHKIYSLFNMKNNIEELQDSALQSDYHYLKRCRILNQQVIFATKDGTHVNLFQIIPTYEQGTVFFLATDLNINQTKIIMKEQGFRTVPFSKDNVLIYQKFNLYIQINFENNKLLFVTVTQDFQ